MNTITIEISKLLPILSGNKQIHDNIYNASVSGYWVKAEEILNEKLVKVRKQEQIESYLGLSYPVSYANNYERVIAMAQLSSEPKVTLTSREFDCYVRNKWDWAGTFTTTNSTYITGAYVRGLIFSGCSF